MASRSKTVRQLCADLGVKIVQPSDLRPDRCKVTTAVKVLKKLLDERGEQHFISVVRSIADSGGNDRMLIAPVIKAVDAVLCEYPIWCGRDSELIEIFDTVNLRALYEEAKLAKGVMPRHTALAVILVELLKPVLAPEREQRV